MEEPQQDQKPIPQLEAAFMRLQLFGPDRVDTDTYEECVKRLKTHSELSMGVWTEIHRVVEVLQTMVDDAAFADLCAGVGEEPAWLKRARVLLGGAQ